MRNCVNYYSNILTLQNQSMRGSMKYGSVKLNVSVFNIGHLYFRLRQACKCKHLALFV